MRVRDIMTTEVVTVRPETPIRDVAATMRSNSISGVPVVSSGKVVGLITEIDLIQRHAPPRQPRYFPLLWGLIPMRLDDYSQYKEQARHILAINAGQLMTEDPTTIGPDASIEEVADLMMRPGHSLIPVLENGKLAGIVTRTDLVRLIEDLETEE